MSRPRIPSALLESSGAFKRNPERQNKREPKGDAFDSSPPGHFMAEQYLVWQEVIEVIPAGVLQKADRFALEIIANLLYEFRQNPQKMSSAKLAQLCNLLTKCGCTPSGRASIIVSDEQKNKFDGFGPGEKWDGSGNNG